MAIHPFLHQIHYDLFLANETDLKHKKLDDTRHRNLPFSWQVGAQQVIPGLDAAIQCLTQGQIAEIFIPAWFAYGAVGCPPWIPPHAGLLYRVELVEIRAPDAAA
jgi:FKBP-type peptidyl-prolyl cis-trans isomerase